MRVPHLRDPFLAALDRCLQHTLVLPALDEQLLACNLVESTSLTFFTVRLQDDVVLSDGLRYGKDETRVNIELP